MTNKVAIFSLFKKNIDRIVETGFHEFGMEDKFKNSKKIFIKPNLVSDTDEHIKAHCNTETILIEAILKYLQRYNVKIYLGESELNAGLIGRRLSIALEKMGVTELQKYYDFKIVNLTTEPSHRKVIYKFENSIYLKRLELNKILFEVDYIINLPKIKTHKFSIITCAMKNYFGLIPDPFRVKYHNHLNKVLADLNSLFIDKTFNVVDGIVAMEGNGPKWGEPVPLNILIFGDDSAIVDTLVSKVMQIDPEEINYLKLFTTHYHSINLKDLDIIGNINIEEISYPFKRSKLNLYMKFERYILPFSWFHRPLFSNFSVKYILYPLRHLIKKIRGGHCSFYINNKRTQ